MDNTKTDQRGSHPWKSGACLAGNLLLKAVANFELRRTCKTRIMGLAWKADDMLQFTAMGDPASLPALWESSRGAAGRVALS